MRKHAKGIKITTTITREKYVDKKINNKGLEIVKIKPIIPYLINLVSLKINFQSETFGHLQAYLLITYRHFFF